MGKPASKSGCFVMLCYSICNVGVVCIHKHAETLAIAP